jgi:hypothetical protein
VTTVTLHCCGAATCAVPRAFGILQTLSRRSRILRTPDPVSLHLTLATQSPRSNIAPKIATSGWRKPVSGASELPLWRRPRVEAMPASPRICDVRGLDLLRQLNVDSGHIWRRDFQARRRHRGSSSRSVAIGGRQIPGSGLTRRRLHSGRLKGPTLGAYPQLCGQRSRETI